MSKEKSVFNNFNENRKVYLKEKRKCGPFMNEFGEDIISEVVQNEIHVKPKKKKINNDRKNNSSNY